MATTDLGRGSGSPKPDRRRAIATDAGWVVRRPPETHLPAKRMQMGHLIDQCDFVDVLEESAVLGIEVLIDLRHGGQFTDAVRDVVTEDGQEFAIFRDHGRLPLHAISDARRAHPRDPTYEGKLGQ
jgi:hypothetical protein